MSKWLVGIYLILILVIVVIIQIGIYHSNEPAQKEKTETPSFKPMKVRLEETKAATERMEKILKFSERSRESPGKRLWISRGPPNLTRE